MVSLGMSSEKSQAARTDVRRARPAAHRRRSAAISAGSSARAARRGRSSLPLKWPPRRRSADRRPAHPTSPACQAASRKGRPPQAGRTAVVSDALRGWSWKVIVATGAWDSSRRPLAASKLAVHQVPATLEQRCAACGRNARPVPSPMRASSAPRSSRNRPKPRCSALRPGAEQGLATAAGRGRPDEHPQAPALQPVECRMRLDDAIRARLKPLDAAAIAAGRGRSDRLEAKRRRLGLGLRVDQAHDLGAIVGGTLAAHHEAHGVARGGADRIAIGQDRGHLCLPGDR